MVGVVVVRVHRRVEDLHIVGILGLNTAEKRRREAHQEQTNQQQSMLHDLNPVETVYESLGNMIGHFSSNRCIIDLKGLLLD